MVMVLDIISRISYLFSTSIDPYMLASLVGMGCMNESGSIHDLINK
jgi:hypothetical protein